MTTRDDELTAISGWTDDEIAQDNVRAAGVLYAAAALEELKLIELVERLNELNQNKMLSIGAGEASNLLHEFWDKGYKRMPAAPPRGVFARGARLAAAATGRRRANDAFAGALARARHGARGRLATRSPPAAAALRDNLAEHTDEQTTEGGGRAAHDDRRDRRRAVGHGAAHRLPRPTTCGRSSSAVQRRVRRRARRRARADARHERRR